MTTIAPAESTEALGVDRSFAEVGALARALRTPHAVAAWSESEWRSRTRLAIEQRVAPLLHHTQREAGLEIPGHVAAALRDAYYGSAASNLIRLQELDRLLGVWRRPMRVIVLKGAALATALYENPTLRPMSDLDLLVSDSDFEACLSELTHFGYREGIPEMASGLERSARFQVSLVGGPRERVLIELHRSIVAGQGDSRAPELSWLWRHSEPFHRSPDLRGSLVDARQLNPTANIIYLAAHAMLQHRPEELRLVWLTDIDRLVRRRGEDIDWTEAIAAADRFGWSAALESALELAAEWFQTPTPDTLNPLNPVNARSVEGGARVSVRPGIETQELERGTRVWRELARLEWRERARLTLAILLPSPSYVRWRYPQFGSWWLVGYPYRWSKVLVTAGRAARTWLRHASVRVQRNRS